MSQVVYYLLSKYKALKKTQKTDHHVTTKRKTGVMTPQIKEQEGEETDTRI
jgi:hypothetical protein